MTRPPCVVFDLDGTLVDSLPDIITSFRYGFVERGLPPPSAEEVRVFVGQPLDAMYRHFAPDHVEDLVSLYREHYPKNFLNHSKPFPGVAEALRTLRARGYKLAVATTKHSDTARRFVEALGLRPELDHVQGTDGFPHKPAPDVILHALRALDARGVWMVGDTEHDLHAGRAAGLRTYGVTWGTQSAEELVAARPDELQPDLRRLLEVLPVVASSG